MAALLAILLVCGIKYLGTRLLRRLQPDLPQPLQTAAAFIVAAALLGAAVNLLALAGLAYHWLLKIMAWSVAAGGILEPSRIDKERLLRLYDQAAAGFREQSLWGKGAGALLGVSLIGLLLGALGPPTDADSLNYHPGVPLDILRHHRAYPRPDWPYARLGGLGESLNLLGLAGGTDILGAALQFAGLVPILAAANTFARDNRDRLLVSMLVVGCPVMTFLVFNQKPQMLATAATTVAIFLIAQRFKDIDRVTLLLSCGCVLFAVGCKYSFMMTGAIVLTVGLLASRRASQSSVIQCSGRRALQPVFEPDGSPLPVRALSLVPLVTFMAWGPIKSLLAKVTLAQMALMALLSVSGAATLFPGALTGPLRQRVMTNLAYGYAEADWVNEVLAWVASGIEVA